jgi:hypothetical protein
MAVVLSGNISQNFSGTVMTFTDTSTGVGTLVSRILTIQNANDVVLDTIDMGASLTATYDITADAWFKFTEQIIDETGTYTLTLTYLSTAFYENTFSNTIAQLGCDCNCGNEDLTYADKGELFKAAALRFAAGGFGVAANNNIVAANIYISGS